jgi:acyl carrier protein
VDLNSTVNRDSAAGIGDVRDVVVATLGLHDGALPLDTSTPLLGSVPELDSMAVLELVHDLEERFDIVVEGEDMTADVFESLGSLAAFVDSKLR